ncbi:unnamed protein product [Closterium sp. NIES-53]
MTTPNVLAFEPDSCPIEFAVWLDDLQLFLLTDAKEGVSLFDYVSGTAVAPAADAPALERSQWQTRDAAARLAIRNHLPISERAHFSQHKTAKKLYGAVVARYSSPATAAIGRLMLPYLFPDLSSFTTAEGLISHQRTTDTRFRGGGGDDGGGGEGHGGGGGAGGGGGGGGGGGRGDGGGDGGGDGDGGDDGDGNAGAARGTPRSPLFEGCSPSPLTPSYASAAAAHDYLGAEEVGAASAPSGKRRNGRGSRGGRGSGGGSGGGSGAGGGGGGGGGGGRGGGGGTGSGGGGSSGGGGGGSGGGSGGQGQQRDVPIFDLDYEAILAGMYVFSVNAEDDCYLCVPPDPSTAPGIAPAALGACESAPLGTAPAQALHTFTLHSGASRCFFRDSTTVTPLPAPVPVSLADPSGGPVLARSSTVLPCPAVPSGELSVLHLPSFSTKLLSNAVLQDAGVDTFTPGRQCVAICTCSQTGRHLATFTRAPRSSLYTLTTASCSAPLSPQLHASAQVATQCECRRLSHDTLLWHHRLGHPSLPRLRSMHSRFLVSEAPLQTLHLDVWGPARVRGQGHERYFLLVVDDYTRYTTVFPLQRKGDVPAVLIPWIRAARLQLRERFQSDFPVLRLHSDRGGEFSSDLLAAFYAEHGIRQTFTLPASPQQNGVAERRIGLVMEVARTSMIHAAAPHFLWSFAVRYAAHQLNLWPRVSLPETSPTMLWTGKVGDASRFRVGGARAFVRDTTADKLSPRAIPCVFLGFVPDAPGWQFYDLASHRVFASQDVTFDESVPFYRLFPYRTAPRPLPPLFLTPGPPQVDPLFAPGPAPSGVSQVDPPASAPVEVTGDSGPAWSGAVPGGAELGGAESGGAERVEPGGAEPAREELGGAASGGAASGGAASEGAASGGAESGGARTEGTGAAEAVGVVTKGAGAAGGTGAAGGAGGAGAAEGTGAAGGAGGAGGAGAAGAGGTAQPRLFFAPPSPSSQPPPDSALRQRPVLPLRSGRSGRRVPRQRQPAVSGPPLVVCRPSSPPPRVPLPSPPASSLPVVADPASDQFRTEHSTVACLLATVVTDPSFESVAASALVAELVDFAAACRLDYAASLVAESESVCPPSVGGECALGTDVLEDRQEDLECLTAAAPHLVAMLLGPEGDPDAPDIPTPHSYVEAIAGEYSSQWQTAMDAEMASWKSTGTYVDEVPPPGANIVSGMWIFRVKRPPGSPPVFKARYVARGFRQREGVDFFQNFSPTPKMTTLRVLLHVAAQRDYELHSLDFSTAFLQGSLHEEIWLRRPPGFTWSFPPGTQWSLRQPVHGLRQAPREWHDTLRTTLAALGFSLSTTDPSLFLRTDTSLPPFYILVYVDDLVFATANTEALALVLQRFGFTWSSAQATPLATGHLLSAPPSDESVEPSGPYPELVGCLMYLMTCTRPDLVYPLGLLAHYVAPGQHRKVHMDAAKRVLRYLCSTSGMGLVLGGRVDVVLTGHSDASWVDDQATQRSSQGYTFSLGSGSVS